MTNFLSVFLHRAPCLGYFGVDIPTSSNPILTLLEAGAVIFVLFVLCEKIVTQKNTSAAILVGALLIVVTMVVLHGCK